MGSPPGGGSGEGGGLGACPPRKSFGQPADNNYFVCYIVRKVLLHPT